MAEHDGRHRDALSDFVVPILRSIHVRGTMLTCPFTAVVLIIWYNDNKVALIHKASWRREFNATEHDGGHLDALSNPVVLALRSIYFRGANLVCPFTVVVLIRRSIYCRVTN